MHGRPLGKVVETPRKGYQNSDGSAPTAPEWEAPVRRPASAGSQREGKASVSATSRQPDKNTENWSLSSAPTQYRSAERQDSSASASKPSPTPPLREQTRDRKGSPIDPQAMEKNKNVPRAAANAKPLKGQGTGPAATLPVSVQSEGQNGTGTEAKSLRNGAGSPEAVAVAKSAKTRGNAAVATLPVQLPKQRHPGSTVEFQPPHTSVVSPAFDNLSPLPQFSRRRCYGTFISFVVCVILPTLAVAAYFFHYASDEYYAEFRFSVQQGVPVLPGTMPATASAPVGPSSSAPGATPLQSGSPASPLGGSAPSPSVATAQNFMVNDYLISDKAVEDLQNRIDIKALYSRSEINWLERFDARRPIEKFASYFHRLFFWADYDQVTGVAIATVKAFTPQDALLIAKTLAALSENLINEMNERADRDAVRYAEEESVRAEKRLDEARAELLEFRTKAGVISPNAGTAPSVLTKEQLEQLQHHAAADRNGARAFADVIGNYEKITFDVQYAQDSLVRARQALDLARANAAVQHFYIEPYVTPQLPESSAYPLRALDTFLAGLALLGIWLLGLLLVRTVQDHVI